MNINAKQLLGIDIHNKMDITTVLGFLGQIKAQLTNNNDLRTALGTVWNQFSSAVAQFDNSYAQTRKWMQTAELKDLDTARDKALSAYLQMLKAMLSSPNTEKAQQARLLQSIREKYRLNTGDEYMKETTAVQQFIQEMDVNYQAELARQATGLEEFYQQLKTQNAAFLVKMNERTEAQSAQQKGAVREARLLAEAAYHDLAKALNALAIMETPDTVDYDTLIAQLNAEIDHYKHILAHKGATASGGDKPEPEPEPTPEPEPEPETEP